MEQLFWKKVTRLWQWPWILVRPFLLHFFPLWTDIGLSYSNILDDPYAVLLFAGILMSYGGGSFIKFFFFKPRPLPYVFQNWLEKIDASSFPSIHTSNATIIAMIRSRWWHQSIVSWTDRFLIIPIVVTVVSICAAIALSRIELKKHFTIDVLAGMLFGILIVALLGLAYFYGLFFRWNI